MGRQEAHLPGAVFQRIDSGSAPQLLTSTPQRLDVGVRDSGLGWVEIHARSAEGQVTAMLNASSVAHAAISAQLPAMRDYLASQQVRIHTLASEPFHASADSGRGSSGNQDQGAGARSAAAAISRLPAISAEPDAESLSWIDVRV